MFRICWRRVIWAVPICGVRYRRGSFVFNFDQVWGWRVEFEPRRPPRIAFDDFDPPTASVPHNFARLRNMAREHECQSTQRVDIFIDLGEPGIDPFGHIIEFGARIGIPAAIRIR
jgi:hypothetical protein